jgi:hypothetical protein
MTQVNKEAKAEIKPHSDKFYEWVITMQGMLPCGEWDYRIKMRKEFIDYMEGHDVNHFYSYSHYGGNSHTSDEQTKLYKDIMRDDSHPMRLHLAVDWLSNSPLYGYHGEQPIETKEQASKVRASWNRWVNKVLGLTKNIHESRTEEVK